MISSVTTGKGHLPQAAGALTPPAGQRRLGHDELAQPAGDSPLRGLIVHDDPAMQRALGVIMERCGFQVSLVDGFATDAVRVAEVLRPDAVVIDLALSGDLGLQMLPLFRRASPACMIVVLSPLTALRQRARELGGFGLVDPRDLRHVEDWLLLGTDPEHPCR